MINLKDYASFVCSKLMSLKVGEALSVNTEEKDFDFAREVANCALKYTKVNSKIVVTEMGKPVDVIEFDSEDQTVKPISMAMIRIAHEEKEKDYDKNSLSIVVDKEDMKTIQKLGHLAEPVVMNRRIALPWCVIPVFDENDSRWEELKQTIDNFDNISNSIKYRKQFLEHSDIHKVYITGDGTELEITLPEDAVFACCYSKLRGGREFYNSTDVSSLKVAVDKNSIKGIAHFKAKVLGRPHEFDCTFKDGVMIPNIKTSELNQILSFDEEISKAGFLSFKDKSFELYLGGSITDSLPESVGEDVPDYFNTSLYSLKLSLDERVNIEIEDCEGKKSSLVRKGFFLE